MVTEGNSGVGTATAAAKGISGDVEVDLPSGTYLAPPFSQWGRPKVTRPRPKASTP